MEGKYVQKDAEVAVGQMQKRCFLTEKEMKDEIEVRFGSFVSMATACEDEEDANVSTFQLLHLLNRNTKSSEMKGRKW